MEVFRISREKYSRILTASGKSARWNRDNQFVIYAGQSRALSTLELVVRRNAIQVSFKYEISVISIADDARFYTRKFIKDMPANWKHVDAYTLLQDIGSNWYSNNESLILQVPSVIIPQEFNYIININHPDFSKSNISIVRNEDYFWDDRLLT
ncbi:MAG: RES family NAD+ phosphorylase [Bacteroidia bacterium]